MITYSNLGKMGRLGNQMFQYASLYGAAFLRGYELGIPDEDLSIRQVFKLPSANFVKDLKPTVRYNEPAFTFAGNVWLIDDNTDLIGYFQSPNYFMHCMKQVSEEFEFKDEYYEKAVKFLKENDVFDKPLCAIHVRRGDYVNLSHYHKNLTIEEYYRPAHEYLNEHIEDNLSYIVFSDDPEWCKENFSGALISEGNSEGVDMCIMSHCHAHIIANSSFSWWGAALSGSGAVIAPKEWFGPEGPDNWDSLYWQNWVRL